MRTDNKCIFSVLEDFSAADPSDPEKRLMEAVLFSAIDDISKRGDSYREARRYLLSDEEQSLYSFVSICNYLNICPKKIRRLIGLIEPNKSQIFELKAVRD